MSEQLSNSLWTGSSKGGGEKPPALDHPSIPALFFDYQRSRENVTFARFNETIDGPIRNVTWGETGESVLALAAFLQERLGVQVQDRVAILSATRFEWVVADLALLSIGAISTPIYHTSTPPEAGFVLWDSGAQIVFVENQEQFNKVAHLISNPIEVPGSDDLVGGPIQLAIRAIISFERFSHTAGIRDVYFLHDILRDFRGRDTTPVRNTLATIGRKDLAAIVYTSGTTGIFKGVMQTHENHLAMLEGVLLSGLLGDAKEIMLYLPLAHSFARLVAYAAIGGGGSLVFPTVANRERSVFDAKLLFHDIRRLEPRYFPSVPRIFEKIMNSLISESKRSPKARLVRSAIQIYQRLNPKTERRELLTIPEQLRFAFANALVKKVRDGAFGKKFCYAISGGAPCSIEVLKFFHSIGVMIYQGYGLTETTPAMSANTPRFNRFGTVGRPFAGCEVKISPEDGEILTRGRNVAKGYWRRPRATAEVWLADGWFATGDIGTLDQDGFLTITDRKKELIVSAGGKKVAPAFLEGRLKSSEFISHAFVFGELKPYLVALITLELPSMEVWCSKNSVAQNAMHTNARVIELIQREIERFNQDLSSYEQVKRFAILAEDFTIDNGLLSPTLKLRRKVILDRYREMIERLYSSS